MSNRILVPYYTNITATWELFDIDTVEGQLILDLFNTIDRSFSGFVSLPRFSSCYCGRFSKLFDFIVKGLLAVMIELKKLSLGRSHGWINAENKLSNFVVLNCLIFVCCLHTNEYCGFLFWCALSGKEDDILKENILVSLQSIAELSVGCLGENEKVKGQFLKWRKLLEQTDETDLNLRELTSIDLRCGGPVTSIMAQLVKALKQSTIGVNSWKKVTSKVKYNIEHVKDIYLKKFKNDKGEFLYDVEIFNRKKKVREDIRIIARLFQSFFFLMETKDTMHSTQSSFMHQIKNFFEKYFSTEKVTQNPLAVSISSGHDDHQFREPMEAIDIVKEKVENIINISKMARAEARRLEGELNEEFELK